MRVKAFGMMTRRPVKKEQLPTDLREAAPVDRRVGSTARRASSAPMFTRFHEALEPLRGAGKLSGTFPVPAVHRLQGSLARLPRVGRRAEGDDEMLVEFRRAELVRGGRPRRGTFDSLRGRRMSLVVVDAPKVQARILPRTLLRVAGPTSTHGSGRTEISWSTSQGSTAERFDYLYTEDELREWVEPLRELAAKAETRTRSSTTTTARRATAATAAMSPRARRTRRCSRSCWRKPRPGVAGTGRSRLRARRGTRQAAR